MAFATLGAHGWLSRPWILDRLAEVGPPPAVDLAVNPRVSAGTIERLDRIHHQTAFLRHVVCQDPELDPDLLVRLAQLPSPLGAQELQRDLRAAAPPSAWSRPALSPLDPATGESATEGSHALVRRRAPAPVADPVGGAYAPPRMPGSLVAHPHSGPAVWEALESHHVARTTPLFWSLLASAPRLSAYPEWLPRLRSGTAAYTQLPTRSLGHLLEQAALPEPDQAHGLQLLVERPSEELGAVIQDFSARAWARIPRPVRAVLLHHAPRDARLDILRRLGALPEPPSPPAAGGPTGRVPA